MGFHTRVIDLEHHINEFSEINISVIINIENREESFSQNTRKVGVLDNRYFVDALVLFITSLGKILEYIFEIGNDDFLLKSFTFD